MPSSCLVIIPRVHLILTLSHAIMPQVHLSANNLNDPDSEQMLKHSNLRQIYLSCNPIKVYRTTIYLSYVIATIIYFQYVHISHLTQPHPGLLESFPSPNLQLFKVNQLNSKICSKTLRWSMNHRKQQIWTVPNFFSRVIYSITQKQYSIEPSWFMVQSVSEPTLSNPSNKVDQVAAKNATSAFNVRTRTVVA